MSVVAHTATRQLVWLVAVRLYELFLRVAGLTAAAEAKSTATAHAVAVRAFRAKRRMLDEWFGDSPSGVASRSKPDLVNAIGRL